VQRRKLGPDGERTNQETNDPSPWDFPGSLEVRN
jgi:hypothetical protein